MWSEDRKDIGGKPGVVIVCGGLQEAEYIRVNVDLAIGIPGWSPALVLGVGVGMGSAFDGRAWSVLGKSQVSGGGTDLILGNLGNSQGRGGVGKGGGKGFLRGY